MVHVRLGRFVEHRLIGSTELVMYNAHRCFLQIGEDRSKEFPGVSHLPPIVSRDLKDGAEALTALGLWMLSPVLKVQVKVEEKMFDYVLLFYLFRLNYVFYELLLNKIGFLLNFVHCSV